MNFLKGIIDDKEKILEKQEKVKDSDSKIEKFY